VNAIATQINFNQNEDPNAPIILHGQPCDCQIGCNVSTSVEEQFRFLGSATTPGNPAHLPKLALAYLDCYIDNLTPTQKYQAGRNLCDWVINYIYRGGDPNVQIKLILAIQHVNGKNLVFGFEQRAAELGLKGNFFANRIGYDFYQTDSSPQEVQEIWDSARVTNVWHGDGSLCDADVICAELERLLMFKSLPWVDKIEYWSVSTLKALQFVLENGVDAAIIGDIPNWQQLFTNYSNRYRLATRQDDPWTRIPSQSQCPAAPYPTSYASAPQYTPAPQYSAQYSLGSY
jgi:hypothetical protein